MAHEFPAAPELVSDSDLPWDFGKPAAAESKFRVLLGPDPKSAAGNARSIELLTQLARAQSLQGRLADAADTLAAAEKLLPTINAVAPRLRTLLERGRLHTLNRTPAMARALFLDVWKLASEAGEDFFAIDASQMISVIETHKLQIDWTHKAHGLAEASRDPRAQRWRGPLYLAVGWHFFDLRVYDKAIANFEKAAACFEADGEERRFLVARCCIGRGLRAVQRVEEALKIQREVLDALNRKRIEDGLVYEEIAECLQALKKTTEAQPFFASACRLLSEDDWLTNNQSARLNRLKTLGKVK